MGKYRLSRAIGWVTIAFGPPLALLLRRLIPALAVDAVLFVALMQFLAGAALVYAAGQAMAGTAIGHKVFPATWVFFLFFLLMTWRLLSDTLAAI
jgi:hypothetical protein